MRINETITVENLDSANVRIDKYISDIIRKLTRSQLKTRNAAICLNGKEVKLSKTVRNGDEITIEYDCEPETSVIPEDIPLDIIYEDENVAIINKAQGMVVHPAAGNPVGTLANALLYHISGNNTDFEDDDNRPGIVHRLDKDTSGLIATAKNINTHEFLSDQFRLKKVRKKYIAAVRGKLPASGGTVDTYLARDRNSRKKFEVSNGRGKHALTHYRVIKEFEDFSLVMLEPETGRTHQLRVHMKHLGCPIIGDPLYSRKNTRFADYTLMLHAYLLEIAVPGSGLKRFHAPLPERFKKIIREYR